MNNSTRNIAAAGGFTLVDVLMVVTILAVIAGIALPTLGNVSDSIRLGEGARQLERELQTARLRAVTTNRAIHVKFNCPSAGEYRMVEMLGTPSNPATADAPNDKGRCSLQNYPYPSADQSPITKPNHDGPLQRLHKDLTFNPAPATLEFWPDGSVHAEQGDTQRPWKPLSGTGTAITLVKGSKSKSITVNGLGKIKLQ